MNKNSRSLAKTLARYLIEIIVIFIGITFSFVFDQWRESKAIRQNEIDFVKSLLNDLAIKKEELKGDSQGAKAVLDNISITVSKYYQRQIIPDSSLEFLLKMDYSIWYFNPTTPSYLKSKAEDWELLPDSLRQKIFHVYEFDFHALNYHYQKVNQIKYDFTQNYLTQKGISRFLRDMKKGNLEYKVGYAKIRDLILSPESINHWELMDMYVLGNRKMHQTTIDHISDLEKNLREYLKKI